MTLTAEQTKTAIAVAIFASLVTAWTYSVKSKRSKRLKAPAQSDSEKGLLASGPGKSSVTLGPEAQGRVLEGLVIDNLIRTPELRHY